MNRDSHPGRARLQLAVSTWLVHAWSGVQESNLHLEGQSLASSPLDTTPIGANTGNRTRIPAIPARCTAVVRCRRGRAGCPTSWRGSESNRPQSHCKCDSPPWNMPPRGAAYGKRTRLHVIDNHLATPVASRSERWPRGLRRPRSVNRTMDWYGTRELNPARPPCKRGLIPDEPSRVRRGDRNRTCPMSRIRTGRHTLRLHLEIATSLEAARRWSGWFRGLGAANRRGIAPRWSGLEANLVT